MLGDYMTKPLQGEKFREFMLRYVLSVHLKSNEEQERKE